MPAPLQSNQTIITHLDPLPPVRYEDRLIDRKCLSEWTGITYERLGIWDRQGLGPKSLRLGRRIVHRIGDVLAWLEKAATVAPIRYRPRRKPTGGLSIKPATKNNQKSA